MSNRNRRKGRLEAEIADLDRRIAELLEERDGRIKQIGLLEAVELFESAALGAGSIREQAAGYRTETPDPATAEPPGIVSIGTVDRETAYEPVLIDVDALDGCVGRGNERNRTAALKMIEILEKNHPTEVDASTIDDFITKAELCSLALFAKIKSKLSQARIVSYNNSTKTWRISDSPKLKRQAATISMQ
ncbi:MULTISPECIES: hypothetical protein [Methylobacterium]|uniref:hypothetical protein n=1 Tax=Methylobacterium TaxID=407 RepID=UPI001EDC9F81|nr:MULTISPECIES: hypothetical protein [Methylobacterium]MBY0296764.1 hypothetical protein [Methylobacterium sp.]MDN3625730.1 hypothetical protein [Methylobacterium isbiliense]